MESIVKKVNRHKREALIEIEIMGDARLVTVALEIVKKVQAIGVKMLLFGKVLYMKQQRNQGFLLK